MSFHIRYDGQIKKIIKKFLFVILVILVSIVMLMPFGWILGTSMRKASESFALPPVFFPTEWNIENYRSVLNAIPFFQYTWNSLFISVVSTFFMVITASMAAYAFSRIEFKGKKIMFPIVISGMMIPAQSIIIPTFLITRAINVIDTPWSIIFTSIYYPVGFFLLRQSMMTIPKSYDEAAYCDGAGRFTIFTKIILPMSKSPLIVACSMFFINIWNEFFKAMIFLTSSSNLTLPLGIRMLNTSHGNSNMPLITAAVVLSLIVPLLFYLFGQKYLMQGALISGLKS
ncbi:carbohydrate ABC transporter permease [[Clostridium] leptum]|uniref:Carbohydrate ABC transporter permease n=1 Tax=[Clostridium] leptum TaxID=1535 RepID=A0A412AT88_9FIRM|nr:carbohydrate ABC transporter permease [[Clostridium] leptum]